MKSRMKMICENKLNGIKTSFIWIRTRFDTNESNDDKLNANK